LYYTASGIFTPIGGRPVHINKLTFLHQVGISNYLVPNQLLLPIGSLIVHNATEAAPPPPQEHVSVTTGSDK